MNREGETSANKRYVDEGATNFCSTLPGQRRNDTGSAVRFFYQAKASKHDRADSKHPTVKPITLIRYLARLVTPPNGRILDPFAGSGTTGAAAFLEDFDSVLIERELEYQTDIQRRIMGLSK
jgi:site-specific DNA-methyltransferase (adenine-specific)